MAEDFDFQDDLFDDLLNDLVNEDFSGDLVSYPPPDFMTQETSLDIFDSFDMNQQDASIPIFPPPPPLEDESPNQNHSNKANKRKNKELEVNKSSAERIKALTLLPILIFKAFNGGDLPKVKEIIKEVTTKHCALKTPALDDEIFGQQHVNDLFQALYDSHPDGVWVAKQCKLNDELNVVQARVYFAGTRIATSYSSSMDLNSSGHADYLFKRKGSSLLDEMDTKSMSTQEIAAMKELEKVSKNLSVFFKGTLELVVEEGTDKIVKFNFDWVITSFREADLQG